jgi:hypothetical protein
MAKHERVEVRFEQERFGPKAEVCWQCSDPDAGVWVPVSFCPDAAATLPSWEDDAYGWPVDTRLQYYTVPDAPSMWDEPPYDPLDRWDAYA